MFSPSGAFLRTISRRGEGPGEFSFVARMLLTGSDTLHVFDLVSHRWTVLSPTQQVLRTAIYPGRFNHEAVILSNGRAVLNLFLATPAAAGLPLHVIAPNGNADRSFGAENQQPIRYDLPSGWARVLTRASDSTVWASKINEYRIALWHVSGRKLLEVVRQPQPFMPWLERSLPSESEPPQPLIRAIHQDPEGRLWVLYHVPNQHWRDALEEVRTPEGPVRLGSKSGLYDTMIEVIDPTRRIVLASQRVSAALEGFAADGLAYSFDEVLLQAKVWQLRLIRP